MIFRLFLVLLLSFCSTSWSQESISETQFLTDLVRLKSLSGDEAAVSEYIEKWAIAQGFYIKKFKAENGQPNLVVSLFPLELKKPNIILTSHFDVVDVSDSATWRKPPFSGAVVNDTIWGRGSIDCKGLAVMQLFAMKRLKAEKDLSQFQYNISFLGLVEEEEKSINGAQFVVENYLSDLNAVLVLGEGGAGLTGVLESNPEQPVFAVSVADKSSLWLRMEAKSRAFGHGAVPSELYANKRLIKALIQVLDEERSIQFDPVVKSMFREIGELEGGLRGFVLKRIHWRIFRPIAKKNFKEGTPFHVLVDNTISVTRIQSSSTASNQMSDQASAVLDCRLLPGTDVDKYIRKLKRTTLFRVDIEVIHQSPAAEPSPKTPFYAKLSEAIQAIYSTAAVVPVLFPATTDNNFFRQKGIPVYGLIPSIVSLEMMESVHSNNERIGVDNLQKGIAVYGEFLGRL